MGWGGVKFSWMGWSKVQGVGWRYIVGTPLPICLPAPHFLCSVVPCFTPTKSCLMLFHMSCHWSDHLLRTDVCTVCSSFGRQESHWMLNTNTNFSARRFSNVCLSWAFFLFVYLLVSWLLRYFLSFLTWHWTSSSFFLFIVGGCGWNDGCGWM